VVFIFALVNMLYYIQWFAYAEPFLPPWDEANFVMVTNDPSNMLSGSICHHFIEDFCINIH
jgi:hypothetical protein